MDNHIRVGITHGDINGVGYEVILKAISAEGITDLFTPVVFGYQEIADKAKQLLDLSDLNLHVIKNIEDIKDGVINLVQLPGKVPEVRPGEIRYEAGESAVLALEAASKALRNQDIDVMVTAPISKESVQSERFKFPGHTEYLTARLGEGKEGMMILCDDSLRVALLTKHIPISKISENITRDKVVDAVETFASILKKDYGIVRPAIAVLSLNPHAGDGGLLGNEEEEIIKPALDHLVQKGYLAFGPFPADGFFGHSSYKNYDGILAMYHDQGLAPFKTIAISGGVNYTGNLPFIRTSPDHGTAFDIAWKGVADSTSMREAIYMAIDIFRRRNQYEEMTANPLKKYVHEKPERSERFDRFQNKNELNQELDD